MNSPLLTSLKIDLPFLNSPGEMGTLIRNYDWSNSSIGLPQYWPQSLRTTLSIILNSKFPMFLFWGPDHICFYNDAYRPSLGNDGKHPFILGKKGEDAWKEAWHINKPLIKTALAGGEANLSEDMLIPIFRNGKMEDVYWTFSHSAVYDESAKPAGVLVTCNETTEKIKNFQQLNESKEQLTFAIEATGLSTWDYNPVTGKFTGNDRIKEWFGLPPDAEIALEMAMDVIAEHDRPRVSKAIEHALENSYGGYYDTEYTIIHPVTKKERIVRAQGRAWFNDKNEPYRFNGTLQDITKEVIARKEIKESGERFQGAVEAVKGILWTNNAIGEMEGEQPGWSALTGQTFEEYQGYGWASAVHPDDAQGSIEAWNEAVKERKTFVFEHRVKMKNGEWGNFSIRAIPIFSLEGTIREWVGVHTDITEKRNAEEAIKESERNLRNIILQSPVAMCILRGLDYNVEIANTRMFDLWGKKPAEVMNKPIFEGLPEAREQGLDLLLENVFATGELFQTFERPVNLPRDGKIETTYLNFAFQPLKEIDGSISGIMAVAIEVTEQVLARKKIEESENYFRQLTDTVPAIIWITEPKGNCIYLNKNWYEFTGQNEKEAEGFGWLDATHPDDKEMAGKAFLEANKNYTTFTALYRLRNKNGEYRWAIDTGSPRFGTDGKYEGMIGSVVDVHEQSQAEEMLRYRKALLEAHIDASLDGILLVDVNGKIISYNQRFIKIWNMPQEIVDAKDDEAALSFAMTQLIYPEKFIEKVKYLYDHQTETSVDELEFKDGKIIERHGYPVVGDDGSYYVWSWMFRDITDQVNINKAIKISEERFRLLADEMPQFVWVGDAMGNLTYFNKAVYEYAGFKEEDFLNGKWIQIVHPDDTEENKRLWQHSIATGDHFNYEHRFRNKEGEYRWQLSRAVPQKDMNGVIQQWIGTSTDINDRKMFIEKLEKMVEERTKKLNTLNAELLQSNEDLQQFAHVASHDLKEPVRKILTFTNRMHDEMSNALNERGKFYLSRIQSAADRMVSMIDGVLTYSGINASEQKLQKIDLNEIITSILTDVEVAIQQKGAIIQFNNLPEIEGAPVLIYQLFYNLINNSLKFAKLDEKLLVTITSKNLVIKDKPFAQITVQDNGIGFENKHSEVIFETFSRLNSKDKYEGTGLGLALCKKIVHRHNGAIEAKGMVPNGAIFTITIPLKQSKT